MCPHQPLPSIGSEQKTPFFRKKHLKTNVRWEHCVAPI